MKPSLIFGRCLCRPYFGADDTALGVCVCDGSGKNVTLFMAGLGCLVPVLGLALGRVFSIKHLLHENMNKWAHSSTWTHNCADNDLPCRGLSWEESVQDGPSGWSSSGGHLATGVNLEMMALLASKSERVRNVKGWVSTVYLQEAACNQELFWEFVYRSLFGGWPPVQQHFLFWRSPRFNCPFLQYGSTLSSTS